jgi:3-hydroxybutyryl-CoA dehydrogenase
MTRKISTIAVLGAGTMGRGIAHVSALGGYRTHLYDPQTDVLADGISSIAVTLDKGVSIGKVDRQAAEAAKGRLYPLRDLDTAVCDADLVIEAVPESIDLKASVFRAAEASAPEHALFASNTSGLSITELAAATTRPKRFAGMHFFNPVHAMRLIELVRGDETSDETIDLLATVGRNMGKEIVIVNESPGFVTSRINALIGNEAFRMLENGVASAEDIDTALKLGLNHPMGPFEMVDLVGLDVRLSILEHLHATLGDLYLPSTLLKEYVSAGRLGRKVGRGVYTYDENGRRTE